MNFILMEINLLLLLTLLWIQAVDGYLTILPQIVKIQIHAVYAYINKNLYTYISLYYKYVRISTYLCIPK